MGSVHVDLHKSPTGPPACLGVTVATGGTCSLDNDLDGKYAHVLHGYGQACQTGFILDPP